MVLRPREDEVAAFWPGGVEAWHDEFDDECPVDRAGVIAAARRQRLEQGDLAVDDATLERVADDVLSDWRLPGLYLTDAEAGDGVSHDVTDSVDDYLERYPGISGGVRMGYRDGRRVMYVRIVVNFEEHRVALEQLGDRVIVERGDVSEAVLEALSERIFGDDEELQALGVHVTGSGPNPWAGTVDVAVVAADGEQAQRTLTERYGPRVRVRDWVPAWREEKVRAFGSWSADGDLLELYYPIDCNGEEPERCEVVESDDAITATVIITDIAAGIKTLVGGFKGMTGALQLRAPLGDRAVIDGSGGEQRPSLAQLRNRSKPEH